MMTIEERLAALEAWKRNIDAAAIEEARKARLWEEVYRAARKRETIINSEGKMVPRGD